jgi:uncharacterized OB-fold protein
MSVDYSDPRYRPRGGGNEDTSFFWDGLKEHRLLIQTCASCGKLRHPPAPACSVCHSLEWTTTESSGRGTLYSFTIHHHPPLGGMTAPFLVALIALEEGVRIVSNIPESPFEDVKIDAPVEVFYIELPDDGAVLHQFRLTEAG